MNPLNPYLSYKRDTSRLIFWVIRVSNTIIRTAKILPDDAPKHPNTTGEVTVASLVALSKLIASRIKPVPRSILALFDSVIQARTESHEAFQQFSSTDPDIERSNASHRHFIDALVEAFDALGGAEYIQERDVRATKEAEQRQAKMEEDVNEYYDEKEDLEDALFSNRFAALGLDDSDDDAESGSEAELEQGQAPRRRQQRRPAGKGKKGKGKGAKKKKGTRVQQPPKATTMDDIPVDLYRFTHDSAGEMTDYLIAVYALFQEIATLRCYVQAQWRDVAYHGMNAAIAGAMSHMAVNFVQRTAAAIFFDFPGHDSYERVLDHITRGDIANVEGLFTVVVHPIPQDCDLSRTNLEQHFASTQPLKHQCINIREQFLVYAFDALVDFVVDYQKTRSGKPTKAMLQEINGWDPRFDIESATEEQRVKWRRSFTINWLYDVVNVFSAVVIQRNQEENNRYPLEEVDWSTSGPWDIYKRVYGLGEFAGFVTSLCFQKPGHDFRSRIQPHHVFQLQCIVDSMAMSRGWIATGLLGHNFRDAPEDFDAQRDIKQFLDREQKRVGQGFLQPVDLLRNLMIKDGMVNNDPTRHEANYELLKSLQNNFQIALGRSEYLRVGNIIPPSRFGSNVDGMWDYCPYLCGVGLEEALREAFHRCLIVIDKLPEPMLILHLHNMLVRRGYITQNISLFSGLQELWSEALYSGGQRPTKKFAQALRGRIQERRVGHPKTKANEDFWTLRYNLFFRRGSFLLQLNAAGWNPDRIPDAEVTVPSTLALHRISQSRPVTDPSTGRKRMEDSLLVSRARAHFSEEQLVESVLEVPRRRQALRGRQHHQQRQVDKQKHPHNSIIPDGFAQASLARAGGSRPLGIETTVLELLELVKLDVWCDVRGTAPLSAINYVWVMIQSMMLFTQCEAALEAAQNPLYLRAYREGTRWADRKRVGFTYLALEDAAAEGGNEECLRILAREFESPRAGFLQHCYWDGLDLEDPEKHFAERGGTDPFDKCTVM
ncbi:hypothetical protein LEL_03597 [Akanthomyces lecanii RCEF 1005]|uniref:DUF6604 domain-containing protein n=1 Tax=Akanthomyces lecanii RCEF 1005 TaxID=1081108 RepID=A0A168J819_CORDF|nr:hypothetical protein LEL_03597 [Akanthomyces lecanii RCEF 1005]